MPANLTYPGVYIQEIPSGVRTITGVATSITAFIGRAAAGPIDDPVTINSFADYERRFGGLAVDSTMSYAVRDFYLNGGSQAVIVRVAHDDAKKATIELRGDGSPTGVLVLEAASQGAWGNRLSAIVDHDTDRALPRSSPPAEDPTLFNLTVRYQTRPGGEELTTEQFLNVSTLQTHPRFLPRVLENESSLVRVQGSMPATRPRSNVRPLGGGKVEATPVPAAGGLDGGDLDANDLVRGEDAKTGLYALDKTDLFNLLCIPPLRRAAPDNPDHPLVNV